MDLRRLRQTMRLAHWSVCPSQVAPMSSGSVDLDDSVHRVRVCVCVVLYPQNGDRIVTADSVTSLSPVRILADADEVWLESVGVRA